MRLSTGQQIVGILSLAYAALFILSLPVSFLFRGINYAALFGPDLARTFEGLQQLSDYTRFVTFAFGIALAITAVSFLQGNTRAATALEFCLYAVAALQLGLALVQLLVAQSYGTIALLLAVLMAGLNVLYAVASVVAGAFLRSRRVFQVQASA